MAKCAACNKSMELSKTFSYSYNNKLFKLCQDCSEQYEMLINDDIDVESKMEAAKYFVNVGRPIYLDTNREYSLFQKALSIHSEYIEVKNKIEEKKNKAEEEAKKLQQEKIKQADSVLNRYYAACKAQKNDNPEYLYEYEMVKIANLSNGESDMSSINRELAIHAANGWRLHTIYSNELGKNASSVGADGLSSGTNSTICEDILIFEKRIKNVL